ncbi:MAG: class III poly(R)-hydroxyalkanoic acid synthase subunit PhaC [Candidatus Methylomirabilales bacterium]
MAENLEHRLGEELKKAERRAEKAMEMALTPPQVEVGVTPHDVVYQENKLRLLHYHPVAEKVSPLPLLMVPAMINRYYVLDLKPGRSLVEYLLTRGVDVYMLDWGIPGPEDRALTWDHYISVYLHNVVRQVRKESRAEGVSLLGYCMGGTMTVIYTALHPGLVTNLITLTAPVNFHDEGLLSLWTKKEYFNVDKMVDVLGNVPPHVMQGAFMMLRPMGQLSKLVNLAEKLDDDEFVDLFFAIETWVNDNVPFPGEAFRKYVKDCYQENLLCQNRLKVNGRRVDLKKIACPLLIIAAAKDHICPPDSAAVLRDLVSSHDKEARILPGGHVGVVSGGAASRHLWPSLGDWLAARSDRA